MTNSSYYDIFATLRSTLHEELLRKQKVIKYSIDNGIQCSWYYIEIAADALTAYNELFPFGFFVKLRDLKKPYHK